MNTRVPMRFKKGKVTICPSYLRGEPATKKHSKSFLKNSDITILLLAGACDCDCEPTRQLPKNSL